MVLGVYALVEFLSIGTNGFLPLCLFLVPLGGSFPSICFVPAQFILFYLIMFYYYPLFSNDTQKGDKP